MGIDFTIVSLLYSENEVDTPSLECLAIKIKIPGARLEQMKTIVWNLILWYFVIHKLFHGFHLIRLFTVSFLDVHITIVYQIIDIEKLFLGGPVEEILRDVLKSVGNEDDHKVLLAHIKGFVHVHCVIVLNDTLDCCFQLRFVLVVHGNANS